MKKSIALILTAAVSASALTMSGCGAKDTADSDLTQVYTSFYAMYDITRQIAGDKAEVHLLCPVGTEPHDYEPKTSEAAKVSNADLFVYNGGGVDSWAAKLSSALDPSNVVCASEAVSIENVGDPHVWLSPVCALDEAAVITSALCSADPDNAESYNANYEGFRAKAEELITAYGDALLELPKRDIVVSHAAFGYLCSLFGLNQIAIEDSQGEEPSPARMAEIVSEMKEKDIKYICGEELQSNKVVETIAAETGAEVVELNPFEGDSDESDYFEVMYENLEVLKTILK